MTKVLLSLSWILASHALVSPGFAQTAVQSAAYPLKPIRLVVPFPAGGPTDQFARQYAQALSMQLGKPVVVDNTGGAGGTIGAAKVANSKPDGYTVLFHNMAQASAPALYSKLTYDPLKDFSPIGMVADVPMVLVVRKDFPAESLHGFIDYVRANPGKLNFANAGFGATSNLCETLMKSTLSASWTSVSYKGTGPALNDLLAGQVDAICDQPASTLQHIRAGNLKAIAVATKERISSLPTSQLSANRECQDFSCQFGMVCMHQKIRQSLLLIGL